jgi:uncharacterized DUF497 family protein
MYQSIAERSYDLPCLERGRLYCSYMAIAFDPAKDALNIEKHGVSLAAAGEMEILAVVPDQRRDYGEDRFNAFGVIAETPYCLSFTVRAISLRRARDKEYRRYVQR